MRHAKSDYPAGVADFDRPLSERGRHEAPVAGRWLVENVPTFDQVLVSGATRTRQTWQLVAKELGQERAAQFDDRIYEASTDTLREVIGQTPESATTLLVIGHNPGIEDLVSQLATLDSELLGQVQQKFPTSAIAVLDVTSLWSKLSDHSNTLTDFVVPRP
jgi:phosphohistidine phosphatase